MAPVKPVFPVKPVAPVKPVNPVAPVNPASQQLFSIQHFGLFWTIVISEVKGALETLQLPLQLFCKHLLRQ